MIVLCQLSLHRRALRGELTRPSFRMPGSPYTSWATLGFVFCVLVLMGLDYPVGTYTVASIPLVALLLALGWFAVRKNIVVLHTPEPVPVDKHP